MALYREDEEKKRAAQQAKKPAGTEHKEGITGIDATKLPLWSGKLELKPPDILEKPGFGMKRPHLPVPQLSLGSPHKDILSGDGLRNLCIASPVIPPPWLPSPSPTHKPSSPAASQDDVNKIWELDFDLDVEPQSLMGRTLMNLHLPLKTEPEAAAERTKQILAVIAGKDAEDTPVGLKLINTAVNLVGATPQVQQALKKLHIDNVSVVFDPGPDEKKYGLKVEFELK